MNVRIQKALAAAGIASRRAVEQMILDGRISVNGQLVLKLPCFVDPEHDDIRVDNRQAPKRSARKEYVLLNKPRGVVCTQRDPGGRPVAAQLVGAKQRLYCAGGLDDETTGLVVLTNDGELTQRLTHGAVSCTYLAEVDGKLSPQSLASLKSGMYFDEKKTAAARVKVLRGTDTWSVLELQTTESRNPRIRRVLARLGHKLRRLKRTAIGPITDRGLKVGHWRPLTEQEVQKILGL
jgi:23S rRNA pseudouridine2605 synthase